MRVCVREREKDHGTNEGGNFNSITAMNFELLFLLFFVLKLQVCRYATAFPALRFEKSLFLFLSEEHKIEK